MGVHNPFGLWHKHGALKHSRHKKPLPPLDNEGLNRIALAYVGKYATTCAKLTSYLRRKLRERGWDGMDDPPVEGIVAKCADLGFVDDRAYAISKAVSFQRRGFGARRLDVALKVAGIDDEAGQGARDAAGAGAWDAAVRFAERKRIGPFAHVQANQSLRQRQFGMMMRAGHPPEIARRLVAAKPNEMPEFTGR
jgi:regulatory protein